MKRLAKCWNRILERCIERKPNSCERLQALEKAEREQLKEIFRRNGYDKV